MKFALLLFVSVGVSALAGVAHRSSNRNYPEPTTPASIDKNVAPKPLPEPRLEGLAGNFRRP